MDDDVLEFSRAYIRSVWALELLLFLRQRADTSWSPEDLVRELRSSESVVSESLASLMAAGLVVAEKAGAYRYMAASPEIDRLAGQLARVHQERPIAVAKAILSTPNDKLKTFANAFKFTKD